MALFHDIVLNEHTGRHELHFVNQQYDYLGGLSWDATFADYRPDIGLDEARALWGEGWDEVLEYARRELPAADRRRMDGAGATLG